MAEAQEPGQAREENGSRLEQLQIAPAESLPLITIGTTDRPVTGPLPGAMVANAQTVNLYIQQSPRTLSEEEKQKAIQGFITDVNSRSALKAKSTIAEGFEEDIEEPQGIEARKVAPVLVKSNFFHGGALLDEVDYSAADEHARRNRKRAREVPVFLPELHNHGRYIILVGGAGSGKTTLIKRYCNMVLDGEILKDNKMVHLVNIKDLSKDNLTPREMLFDKFIVGKHKQERIQYGYEWMQKEENQESILLAFDGIDTAPWLLSDETQHEMINYEDKRPAEIIIYNILHGHLFPNCKILLTSREYGITRFPVSIQPEAVIALKGFTRESIRILVMDLGGDNGAEIWSKLTQKSVNLMLLCSTPIFLIFAIVVYKSHEEDAPENLSGIIITLIEGHIRSKHRQITREKVREMLQKLRVLSLHGLQNGKVIFTAGEFTEHDLDVELVKDLVISVPTPDKSIPGAQNLLEEDYSYFFCHQSVQESLAALQVAGMSMQEFEKFGKEHLHTPKYIVVRQILCGVLYNEETTKLAQKQTYVVEKEEKQRFVLATLENELKKHRDSPMEMLNLLISLRECGRHKSIVEMVKKNLPKISLSGIPLTPSDLHAAACVARHCNKLSIMQLVNCHLDKYSLEVLAEGMKGSDVEITVFDVSFNLNLRKDSMFDLHEICIRGQGLNYWQCGFRQRDILMFNEREAQIQKTEQVALPSTEEVIRRNFVEDGVLDLDSYNVENHFDVLEELISRERQEGENLRLNLVEYERQTDVAPVCRLLSRSENVGEFAISESELTETQLMDIGAAIAEKRIDSLNVFLNPFIEAKGWGALGNIVKTCLTKNLYITACSLTEVKLTNFKFSLRGSQIYKLDISRNDDMDHYCLREIGDIVQTCGVQELVMGYCNFSGEHMKYLKRSVTGGKINRIDMSGNDKMGTEGYHALGEIVYACDVKLIDVSECDPSSDEIANFREAAHTSKITKLNVSRNRHMGKEGLLNVGKMVGQCQLDELFVRQCELEEHTLRSFQQGLGDAKIRHLDFGFYFMKVRPTTEVELGILMEILPHVTEQLTINAWDISEKGRRTLQQALDSLPYTGDGLKIMFNRGKKDFIQQSGPAV